MRRLQSKCKHNDSLTMALRHSKDHRLGFRWKWFHKRPVNSTLVPYYSRRCLLPRIRRKPDRPPAGIRFGVHQYTICLREANQVATVERPAGQRLGTTERYLSPQEIARGPSRLPPLLSAGGK